jgi:integrase
VKLTTTSIRSLALPKGVQEKTFFDDALPAFGVRVRSSGSKSYVVQYKVGSQHRRFPLGAVAAIDLGKARDTAKDILARVRLGEDPFAEKLDKRQKSEQTFSALLPRFLAHQRGRLKPRSLVEVQRHLEVYARPWHTMPVTSIDRAAVATLLAKLGDSNGPGASNRFRASVSAYFNWLAREGMLETNPAAFTNKLTEGGARDRVLTDPELAAIWRAAGDDQYGTIIKLLALTGGRRDEIGALRWSEIDLGKALITLPGERTKNSRPHVIPLAPQAVNLLKVLPRRDGADGEPCAFVFGRTDRPFSGWSKSKRELDARLQAAGASVADWTPHDFRRSLSTSLHERGVAPHIVETLLGHASGHRAGVAGTYNRADYLTQRRTELERWANHIENLVGGKRRRTAIVKPFRRG